MYWPTTPIRQVWLNGVLFYRLRSLYFKNRIVKDKNKQSKPSYSIYVEIHGVLWWRIKIIKQTNKKRLVVQEKKTLKSLPIECIEEVGKEDKRQDT